MCSQVEYSPTGHEKGSSTEAVHLRTPQILQAMPDMVNSFTERIAHPVTAKAVRADIKAALSPATHFWLSSAIRNCARSSSLDGLNWARRTGAATFRENR